MGAARKMSPGPRAPDWRKSDSRPKAAAQTLHFRCFSFPSGFHGTLFGDGEGFQTTSLYSVGKIRNQISGCKKRERESIKKCIRDLYLRISNTYHFQKPSSKANFEGSSLTGISSCVLWSKYPNREELSPQDLELFSIQLTTQNCHVLFWGLRLTNSSRLGFWGGVVFVFCFVLFEMLSCPVILYVLSSRF